MIYRNAKLLRLAQDSPYCFGCGRHNDSTVVAAHSNQLRDGKGRGLKAHDYRIAYLCYACHQFCDSGKESRAARLELWEEAHRKTIGWLFDNEHLKVV